MIISFFLSIVILIISVIIFYEFLRYSWYLINKKYRIKPRRKVLFITFATVISHIITIILYAFIYYYLILLSPQDNILIETITGKNINFNLIDYIYFSATTYSSLGYGDLIPFGGLRIIAMFEVLNGLVLIAWSASAIFLSMQNVWNMRKK